MKKSLPLLGVALGLALLVTGCETDSSSARIQEKSAVYATLKPWQKKYIDTGVVAVNFTPDMVYMAIGNPSTKQPAGETEIWTYKNYYPSVAADKVKYNMNTENQMGAGKVIGGVLMESNGSGGSQVAGSAHGGAGQSISQTGGPQGVSMEPADLQSYTLVITFTKGVVSKMKLDPN